VKEKLIAAGRALRTSHRLTPSDRQRGPNLLQSHRQKPPGGHQQKSAASRIKLTRHQAKALFGFTTSADRTISTQPYA